jgi:hypothetical protein
MSRKQNQSGATHHRKHPLRVFLSYAHSDLNVLDQVVKALESTGMVPVWDDKIKPGAEFTNEIRRLIATSHVFMPILTGNSAANPWIHQEIGFALGIDVPVVPLALGALPDEMIKALQAVIVKKDMSDLFSKVEQLECEDLVLKGQAGSGLEALGVTIQVADFTEDRTRNLVTFAQAVKEPSRIRQRGIFSSFSLPNAEIDDPVWNTIDLPQKRSNYFRQLLKKEREVLEHHAKYGGCSLILRPFLDYRSVGAQVHRQQLELLATFLKSMPNELVTIAITDIGDHGNLTIVGDWFAARALPPRPGSEYRETLFCHHSPTVLRWLKQFDDEVESILCASEVKPNKSRAYALLKIQDRLKQLASV